jgi:hypothetical protein
MTTATRRSTTAVNAAADAIALLLTGGTLEFLTGSRPAQPENSTAETLLASITLAGFDPAVDGLISFEFSAVAVQAAGDVGWWRAKTSGATVILDGPVYEIGETPIIGGLALATLTLADGQVLTGAFEYQEPKAES